MSRREGVYWPGMILVGLVLAASLGMAAWVITGWVKVSTADTVEATLTEVRSPTIRTSSNRGEYSVEFELADGSSHGDSVHTRMLWRPDEGSKVDVYERTAGDWEVAQEHSWPRDVLILLACLVPWALLYFVIDDKVTKRRKKSVRTAD